MPKLSAGVLLFRVRSEVLEVLLAHPGGPFWARKDEGAWSIPKGEYDAGEDPWQAASREFAEETGHPVPDGPRLDLGAVRQSGAKTVAVFAVGADFDAGAVCSNSVSLEWPRGSGRMIEFPEIDRAAWLSLPEARVKILAGQRVFLDRLTDRLSGRGG